MGNNYSNIPSGSAFVVNNSLVVAAPITNQVFNVSTVNFSGKITLNSLAPTRTCSTASPATVLLFDAARGYNLEIPALCNVDFSFSAQVYPGTYKVSVVGNTYSNSPSGSAFVVNNSLVVAAPVTNQVFNVSTVNFSGKITLNSVAPTRTCTTASPATVLLVDSANGYNLEIPALCNVDFSFSAQVYPGTYKVSVVGNNYSNIPSGSEYVVYEALRVQ